MSARPFTHLHCHSHYSLLDGASSIKKLVQRTVDHGMSALALTDHGNLHGALEFYREAKAGGINPIIGYEAYIAAGSRLDRGTHHSGENSYHLTLLCQNKTGFDNLIKMASAASLEGFYFKPRIDKELLEAHHEGIICLSGCVSSEFSRAILRSGGNGAEEHLQQAKDVASWFSDLFGDRYFIEIMNNGIDVQRYQLEGAVSLANEMGLPLVATSDCHYVDREDAEAQDVMLCINTGKFRTDQQRMKMEGTEFYLRSPEDMYANFSGLEDAVARSQQIADSVDIELELGVRHFPVFDLPESEKPEDKLRELCLAGIGRSVRKQSGDVQRGCVLAGSDGPTRSRVGRNQQAGLCKLFLDLLGFCRTGAAAWYSSDGQRKWRWSSRLLCALSEPCLPLEIWFAV